MKKSKVTVSAAMTIMAFTAMTSYSFASQYRDMERGERGYRQGSHDNMEQDSRQRHRIKMGRRLTEDHHMDMINNLVTPEERLINTLTDVEKEQLIYGQQEERLAKEVYEKMYESYSLLNVFNNISKSEDRHVKAMGSLLTAYDLPQTEGYGGLQSTYDSLIAKGGLSLKDAIEVGITIEILDIKDLDTVLASTNKKDIRMIYERLRQASIKHLNAFVRTLQQNGFETELNWQQYTNQEAVNSKGKKGGNGEGCKHGNQNNMRHDEEHLTHGKGKRRGHGGYRFNDDSNEVENFDREESDHRERGKMNGRGQQMRSDQATQALEYRQAQRPWTHDEREEKIRQQSPKKAKYGQKIKEKRKIIRTEFKEKMETLKLQQDSEKITEEEFKKARKELQKVYRKNLRDMRKALKMEYKAEKR